MLQDWNLSARILKSFPPSGRHSVFGHIDRVLPLIRRGGAKIGAVPTDTAGTHQDSEFLRYEFAEVVQLARQLQLPIVNSDFDELRRKKVHFTLAPDRMDRLPPSNAFLQPTDLDSLDRKHSVNDCDAFIQTLPPPPVGSPAPLELESSTCKRIRKSQSSHRIEMDLENLRTLLPDRWADSVVLNAGKHILQEFYPKKSTLYINSAQVDFNWAELAATPRCYRQVISCLFLDSHWTLGFIDHDTKEIFYLNSDIVDKAVPKRQTEPIAKLFPSYQLYIIPCVKQCDSSSCGVYCLWWMYSVLYARDKLLKISCADIRKFRTFMRRWILLLFFVSRFY